MTDDGWLLRAGRGRSTLFEILFDLRFTAAAAGQQDV
jgi:hypothetical protein